MKVKLYRKLLRRGANQINILSITRSGDFINGMSYSYDEDKYSGLFNVGDTELDVKMKAAKIYIKDYLKRKKTK